VDEGEPQIYFPAIGTQRNAGSQGFRTLFARIATASDMTALYARYGEQIIPATDDRPFFNHRVKWSQIRPSVFREVFKEGKPVGWDRPVVELSLLMLLVEVIMMGVILIFSPLVLYARRGIRIEGRSRFLTYFAGLGLGFIMTEIVIVQKFTLFLGQPTYAFAVVLASLLISTGVGAGVANRVRSNPKKSLAFVIPVILAVLIATGWGTPYLFSAVLGLPVAWRICISVLVLSPVGICLGMPFPIGLRIVGKEAEPLVPWAWAVNGFFTVVGSVGAAILGMTFGFKVVLSLGAIAYLVAGVAMMAPEAFATSDLQTSLAGTIRKKQIASETTVSSRAHVISKETRMGRTPHA
jgi:hypothetical protein